MGGGTYRNRADVVLESLYTERVPCTACSNKLRTNHPEADVFYTVVGRDGKRSKGVNLMKKYGLEVPEPEGPKRSLPVVPPRDQEDKR